MNLIVHGTPKPGHEHEFRYDTHGPFSCWSKCKCGATHIRNYSPDGYIGNTPAEVIYEPRCCWFMADAQAKGFTGLDDCKDITVRK